MITSRPLGPVLITGLGLMGGSLAAALTHVGMKVLLHHHRPEVARSAAALGWGTAIDSFDQATKAHLAVVCTPVGIIARTVRAIAAVTSAVITDVGSTKGELAIELNDLTARYIGSHPMCGSHLQGLANADRDLYRGRLTLVTPVMHTNVDHLAAIEQLWVSVGSRVQRLSPTDHDRVVAEVSHLPHILASVTASMLSAEAAPACASGFRDATRIAAGSPDLWVDILQTNSLALRPLIARSQARLAELDALLETGDGEALKKWLAAGKAGRQRFEDAQQ